MQNAIEVQSLYKSFGDLQAVQGASFSAEDGRSVQPARAQRRGKSTTISMLSGLLEPTQGDAAIMGHSIRSDPAAAKACLGVVPAGYRPLPRPLGAREPGFLGQDVRAARRSAQTSAWTKCSRSSG